MDGGCLRLKPSAFFRKVDKFNTLNRKLGVIYDPSEVMHQAILDTSLLEKFPGGDLVTVFGAGRKKSQPAINSSDTIFNRSKGIDKIVVIT